MTSKREVPAFKSEAEEAQWWYKNRARLDKALLEAAGKGELKRLDQRTLKARLAAFKARMVSIRLPEADIQLPIAPSSGVASAPAKSPQPLE